MRLKGEDQPAELDLRPDRALSDGEIQWIQAHGHNRVGNADSKRPFARGQLSESLGRGVMATGREVHCKAPKYRGRSRVLPGAALSFMARGQRGNVRPYLLMVRSSAFGTGE